MTTNDVVRMRCSNGGYRVWRITGVYLGSEHTESLIGLTPLDKNPGSAHGCAITECLVPKELVVNLQDTAELVRADLTDTVDVGVPKDEQQTEPHLTGDAQRVALMCQARRDADGIPQAHEDAEA